MVIPDLVPHLLALHQRLKTQLLTVNDGLLLSAFYVLSHTVVLKCFNVLARVKVNAVICVSSVAYIEND